MTHYYWFHTCPVCSGQGRLLLFKDLTAGQLYLHCEECEWGWRDPDKATDPKAGFLTLNEEFEAAPATKQDIQGEGWEKYALHEFDD